MYSITQGETSGARFKRTFFVVGFFFSRYLSPGNLMIMMIIIMIALMIS